MEKTDESEVDETITTEEQDSAPSEQDQQEQPTIMRVIETPMSDEERIEVGVELTDVLTIIEELETERKAKNASYNDNIKVKQGNAHKLSNKFKAAVHTSERECPIEYNWENNVKLIKHPDTGDTLHEDVISDAERQKFMPGFENQVEGSENMACDNTTCASEVEGRCMKEGADQTCGDYINPSGDLMPCANAKCDEETEGFCTDPEGDVSCKTYKAPEDDTANKYSEGEGGGPTGEGAAEA